MLKLAVESANCIIFHSLRTNHVSLHLNILTITDITELLDERLVIYQNMESSKTNIRNKCININQYQPPALSWTYWLQFLTVIVDIIINVLKKRKGNWISTRSYVRIIYDMYYSTKHNIITCYEIGTFRRYERKMFNTIGKRILQ